MSRLAIAVVIGGLGLCAFARAARSDEAPSSVAAPSDRGADASGPSLACCGPADLQCAMRLSARGPKLAAHVGAARRDVTSFFWSSVYRDLEARIGGWLTEMTGAAEPRAEKLFATPASRH